MKSRKSKERFARLPLRVMESPACVSLSHGEHRVLVAYCGQCNGHNNGSLGLTRGQAAKLGIGHDLLQYAQRSLQEKGLMRMTRRGSRTPPRPHLFALTWLGIEAGKHDVRPEPRPTHDYKNWREKSDSDDRSAVTAMTAQQSRNGLKAPPAMTAQQSRSADSDDRSAVTSKNLPRARAAARVRRGTTRAQNSAVGGLQ